MKRIFWVMFILVACYSCGNHSESDSATIKEDRVVDVKKEAAYGKLIYLDTAEHL